MSSVAEQGKPVVDPGGENVPVQKLPGLETLRVGLVQQRDQRGVEVLVNLQQGVLGGFGTPAWPLLVSTSRLSNF